MALSTPYHVVVYSSNSCWLATRVLTIRLLEFIAITWFALNPLHVHNHRGAYTHTYSHSSYLYIAYGGDAMTMRDECDNVFVLFSAILFILFLVARAAHVLCCSDVSRAHCTVMCHHMNNNFRCVFITRSQQNRVTSVVERKQKTQTHQLH